MPRRNHRRGDHPARRRDNTDYHVTHQAEVAAAGGWYLWHRQQRIQREQEQQGGQQREEDTRVHPA